MFITTKEMYSEVYGVIKALGKEYIRKLPKTVLKVIIENREENYNPKYNMSISLKKQDVNRKTLAMIALLHYNYWCDTEEDRQKLKTILENNEEKHQKEIREKYSNDKIFNNSNIKKEEEKENIKETEIKNEVLLDSNIVEYKQSFFSKIVDKIKKWVKRFKILKK